ncbi:MAG: hypothetical protein ABIS06_17625 [Vicinamibacterales bacterium]
MSDQDDSDRPGDAKFLHSRPAISDENIAAFLGGAAVGACICAVAAYLFGGGETSEEPPIRVKGGSMKFNLLSASVEWVEQGSKRKWGLSLGTRNQPKYKVETTYMRLGQPHTETAYGDTIRIHYGEPSEHFWVEMKISNYKKTTLRSRHDVLPSADKKVLTHTRSIVRIEVGNETPYFAVDGALIQMDVLDY